MQRSTRIVGCGFIAGLVLLAGCLGGMPDDGSDASTTPTLSGSVLTVNMASEEAIEQAPASTKASFDALTADQQDELQSALEHDVEHPTAWDSGSDIEYVRYNGSWYTVEVHIVN